MPAASIFRRAPSPASGAAALLSLLVSGCDSCHASKPYTPYTLSDPSAEASAATTGAGVPPPSTPGGPAGADAGPSFPAVQGIAPPGDGKSWPLEGNATVSAPVGRTFGV